jgi:hypothetical protein
VCTSVTLVVKEVGFLKVRSGHRLSTWHRLYHVTKINTLCRSSTLITVISFVFQAICEIGYEKSGYVACETQRYDTSPVAVMNCGVGSFSNGKRIFLATGQNADCYIYQVKLGTKSSADEATSQDKKNGN